jgi:hypothetical protein
LSGIVLVRQPMQAPTRAIGEIEQHLTGSSLQLLCSRQRNASCNPSLIMKRTFSGNLKMKSMGPCTLKYKKVYFPNQMYLKVHFPKKKYALRLLQFDTYLTPKVFKFNEPCKDGRRYSRVTYLLVYN